MPDDEQSYGFFAPLDAASSAPAPEITAPAEDEGFGFFEPLPIVVAPEVKSDGAGEEGDGYGFFAPLAAVEKTSEPLEEGDGFGFFVPLPSPVVPDASPAPAPLPAAEINSPPASAAPESLPVEARSRVAKAPAPAAAGDSSIRVSIEKVDQLINLVGELVITQAMLLQTATQMQENAPERLVNGLAQLERNTRDLQESVMSIRMMPISFVFSRFPRVVRDLSGKLGKQVELKTSGETTELDKSLIERIADPLTHLIRNSLDHGIELPDKRIAAGKNPVGTITLKAYHQGGNIVIEVGDDGGGLPRKQDSCQGSRAWFPGLRSDDGFGGLQPHFRGRVFDGGTSYRCLRPRCRHGCRTPKHPVHGRSGRDRIDAWRRHPDDGSSAADAGDS